jgi:DinB superfamily
MSDDVLERLANTQQIVIGMLRVAADDPSARIGAWSLRDIAAHLAATERECYIDRMRAIANGEHPTFDFFTHDEADFSGTHLENAIDDWLSAREELISFVRALSPDARQLTGLHERYGEVTVDRYLEIALEHDQDHLRGLERLAGEPTH